MKNNIVVIPPMKKLVHPSPGFQKKELADYKLDLVGLCGFGCRYCSSNSGNYLRINREEFAREAEVQIGRRATPANDPDLMLVYPDVVAQLEAELAQVGPSFGRGKTLVFSMLTDGFSPWLVEQGITRRALELVLAHTAFRVRVLTKNAIVGSPEWVEFFSTHRDRFVVGLSTGSLDEKWSRQVELGTSSPAERLAALRALQDAGVPTFGMLCPVFPDVLDGNGIERLVESVRPDRAETVWAEAYNDRVNWKHVRGGYTPGSNGHAWLTEVYERRQTPLWSKYATDLYVRLREHAERHGWLDKLRFLLYEDLITQEDARRLGDMSGILLQSKPGPDGLSQNAHIASAQMERVFAILEAAQ